MAQKPGSALYRLIIPQTHACRSVSWNIQRCKRWWILHDALCIAANSIGTCGFIFLRVWWERGPFPVVETNSVVLQILSSNLLKPIRSRLFWIEEMYLYYPTGCETTLSFGRYCTYLYTFRRLLPARRVCILWQSGLEVSPPWVDERKRIGLITLSINSKELRWYSSNAVLFLWGGWGERRCAASEPPRDDVTGVIMVSSFLITECIGISPDHQRHPAVRDNDFVAPMSKLDGRWHQNRQKPNSD